MSFSAELSRAKTVDVTGVLSFPKLLEPEEGQDGQLKYSCALLLDPADETQLDALKAAINAAIQLKWKKGPPEGLMFPLRNGNDKPYAGYAGKLYITAKTKDRPVLLAWRNKVPATTNDLVPGYTVVARITAFAYENRSGRVSFVGVAFALNAVWVIKHGDRLDGRPTEAYLRENIGNLATQQLQIDVEVDEVSGSAHVPAEPLKIPASTQTSSTVERLLAGLSKPD
jgi:hypothetical protein